MTRANLIKEILIRCFPESASDRTFDVDEFVDAMNGDTDKTAYDVGLDSLDFVEAVIAIEDELNVEINDTAIDAKKVDCTVPLKDLPELLSACIY